MSAPVASVQQSSLRPYQVEALARIEAAGKRRILVCAPTGSGKTVIASAITKAVIERGQTREILFLVHRRELVTQAHRKLFEAGIDAGIIAAGFPPRPGQQVQIASIQTLHVRAVRTAKIELPRADLVIVDECHHARAKTWTAILDAYPESTIVGLTATPCRGDGRGLGKLFDELVEVSTVAELTKLGFLVPTKIYAPSRPDLTGVRVQRGDYVETELADRVNTAKLVGDIVEHWLKLNPDRRRTVIYAVNVAHSVHIRDEFRRAGILAEHIDGTTPIEERDRILARLATGTVEIVTNCQVLTEGWDCPEVGCIVLARPTKSLGLYRQMTGRGLRPANGKTDVLILDHSGAVFQHGFVDDPIQWALHEDCRAENRTHGARGQYGGPPALTTCPECSAIRMQGKPCPVCGWRTVPKAKPIVVADGELGAVDRRRNVHVAQPDPLTFFRELRWLAERHGHKPGSAFYKFQEKFGTKPPRHWGEPPPLPASPSTVAWFRSRQIAFAKSRSRR